MAIDFKKCRETKGGNIITPKARLSYPNLFTPNARAKTQDGKLKYTLSVLIPPDADIGPLKAAAEKAAIDEFGAEKMKSLVEMKRFNIPWLDAFEKSRTEKNPAGDEQFKGWTLLRVTSLQKPQIVNAKLENVDDESEVYPGRWACVSLRPFAYPARTGGNAGVSFGLRNVQLLDHDTPLAGSNVQAQDEFEPVDTDGGEDAPSEGATADSVFS